MFPVPFRCSARVQSEAPDSVCGGWRSLFCGRNKRYYFFHAREPGVIRRGQLHNCIRLPLSIRCRTGQPDSGYIRALRRSRGLILNTVIAVLFVLAVFAFPARRAHSRLLGIQSQLRYDLLQTKQRGLSLIEDGRFSADYALVMRRPLLATSTLVSDLSFNVAGNGDAGASRSTRGWTLNMYSDQSKYTLVGRVSRSSYGASSGLLSSSTGFWSDYSLGLLLRQPAYPVVNVQFSRNVSGTSLSGPGGDYVSSNWLISSYYDMAPFRFSYDHTRQTLGYSGQPGTQMRGQNSAVMLSHALLPGLTLSGELSRAVTTIALPFADTSNNTNRRAIRLSATPTRSIVADVGFISQSDEQSTGLVTRSNDNNAIAWNIRSQLLPGLSLDYGNQRQTQTGNAFEDSNSDTSRNRNLSLVARLSEDTAISVVTTHTSFGAGNTGSSTEQDSLQSSLHTSFTKTTDFGLNYGRSTSATGQTGVRQFFCGCIHKGSDLRESLYRGDLPPHGGPYIRCGRRCDFPARGHRGYGHTMAASV